MVCHDVVTDEKIVQLCRYIKPKALIPECHILVQDNNNAVHEKTKKCGEMKFKKKKLLFFHVVSYKKHWYVRFSLHWLPQIGLQEFCSVRMLFHIETIRVIRPAESFSLGSVSHFSLFNTLMMSLRLGRLANHPYCLCRTLNTRKLSTVAAPFQSKQKNTV